MEQEVGRAGSGRMKGKRGSAWREGYEVERADGASFLSLLVLLSACCFA